MIEQGGTKRVSLDESDSEIGQVRITDGTDIVDVIDLGTYAGIGSVLLNASGNPVNPPVSDGTATMTAASPSVATVGTGSAAILSADATRAMVVLTNTSDNDISLSFGAVPAVLYSGITLTPKIGVIISNNFARLEIRAIASAASSNLAIQVGTLV